MPYYKKKYRDIADEETNGTVPPKTIVLLQEMDRYNSLTKKMTTSLKDVQRALIGEIGMSPELEDLANSLFNGFLPGGKASPGLHITGSYPYMRRIRPGRW